MFRILIVEDIANTLAELCELLREIFPDSFIEACSTVEEGLRQISLAAARGCPFDVAILDFKLPARKGEHPEIDESLCQAIKTAMLGTLVIHITAFHQDPKVIKHIADYHSGTKDPRVELIAKTAYWPEALLGEMKAYLYGKLLETPLDKLFRGQSATTAAGEGGSLTHELATLSRDIATYWEDLNETTKTRVQQLFHVTKDGEDIRVSLRLSR
ncbi:MAG: response regulator [Acidobacteria bacterium]|nr:response regulator [Acidobacteriota bacterium]MBI3426230.1 response regulator [Acidobacteriota bacterium]